MDSAQSEWLCRELGYVLSAEAAEFNANKPTLRDHLAMSAMQALITATTLSCDKTPARIAHLAYEQADSMLKAREPKAEAT